MRQSLADRVDNNNDIIDSRDVIERIDELESELSSLECEACEGTGHVDDVSDGAEEGATVECSACGSEGTVDASKATPENADSTIASRSQTFLSEFQDELEELWKLRAFLDEMDQNAGEGVQYGVCAVRDSYFQQHAEDEADSVGAIDKNAGWPLNCINWEKAADQLKQDYSSIDYDGVEYWVRS